MGSRARVLGERKREKFQGRREDRTMRLLNSERGGDGPAHPRDRRWIRRFIIVMALCCLGGISGAPGANAPTHAPVFVGAQRLFDVGGLPDQSAADRAAAINRRIDSFV